MVVCRRLASRSWAVLVIGLLLILGGCARFDSNVTISAEDKVDFALDLAVNNNQVADQVAQACREASAQLGSVLTIYERDGYRGCSLRGSQVPVESLSEEGSPLQVTHADGQYGFVLGLGDLDLPVNGLGGMSAAAAFDRFSVTVTFPGRIVDHSGSSTVEGNTVTWTSASELFTKEGMRATAQEPGAPIVPVPVIAGAFLAAAAAGGGALYARSRRQKATVALQASVQPQPWSYPQQPDTYPPPGTNPQQPGYPSGPYQEPGSGASGSGSDGW